MTGTRAWDGRRLHFIGVGGCGMSALALCADRLGARVTGSDRSDGHYLPRLRERRIPIAVGHRTSVIPDGAEVIVSSAVPFDNEERRRAREAGHRERTRGQLLAELLPLRRSIAVAGTHGKTTTAAMIVHALRSSGQAVDYVIGGDLLDTGTNAEWEDGTWLVVETDESDGSLLELSPDVAVLTNAELDHVERFDSVDDVESEFATFLRRAGRAVVWDRHRLVAISDGPTSTFDAVSPDLFPGGSRFDWHGRTIHLPVPGAHNARNAAAALETCVVVGVDPEVAATALADFAGVARRCQWVGSTRSGAQVIDDYAHHPTEVAATVAAVRSFRPERLVVVLRPWGRARTRLMAADYGSALTDADEVVVLDVAGGAEPGRGERDGDGQRNGDVAGVTAALIVDAADTSAPGRPVHWIPEPQDAISFVDGIVDRGTVVLTLGCGDVAGGLVAVPASGRLLPESIGAHR